MQKLSNGLLDCGHWQFVSEARTSYAINGREQHGVWCVECNRWSKLVHVETKQED